MTEGKCSESSKLSAHERLDYRCYFIQVLLRRTFMDSLVGNRIIVNTRSGCLCFAQLGFEIIQGWRSPR